MLTRHTLSLAIASGIVCLISHNLKAGDPATNKKPLTAKECEQLIERLVNPGKPPFKDKGPVFPEDVPVTESTLRKSQWPIAEAYNTLSDHIEEALPVLMKHIDDDRFSYVYEVPISGAYHLKNVGQACRKIIQDHVEIYHKCTALRYDVGRTKALWFIDGECGGIDKLWKSRKDKSLADLQLEGIDWVLKQPKPNWFKSHKKWDAAKKELDKMAQTIRKTKKPILDEHHVHFFPD